MLLNKRLPCLSCIESLRKGCTESASLAPSGSNRLLFYSLAVMAINPLDTWSAGAWAEHAGRRSRRRRFPTREVRRDNGVIAVPKKKEAPEDVPPACAAPAAPKCEKSRGAGHVSLRLDVPEVTVDVGVLLEKTHQFVPGLKPDNFRV